MSVLYLAGRQQLSSSEWMNGALACGRWIYGGLRLATSLVGGWLKLTVKELQNLVNLMIHFKIAHLQCQSVDFTAITSTEGSEINLKECSSFLKTIELIDCKTTIRLIVRAVCDCPLLESVKTQAVFSDYPPNLDVQCHIMAKNLNKNCRFYHFDLCELTAYSAKCNKWLLPTFVDAFNGHCNFIQEIIQRNAAGWVSCRQAIYQLYLIKRHGASPLFLCLNRDVVGIIARLLYASRFTEAWCPLLKFP